MSPKTFLISSIVTEYKEYKADNLVINKIQSYCNDNQCYHNKYLSLLPRITNYYMLTLLLFFVITVATCTATAANIVIGLPTILAEDVASNIRIF